MPANWRRDDAIAEAGDQRPAFRNRLLDGREREGRLVLALLSQASVIQIASASLASVATM